MVTQSSCTNVQEMLDFSRQQLEAIAAHCDEYIIVWELLRSNDQKLNAECRKIREKMTSFRREIVLRFLVGCHLRMDIDRETAVELVLLATDAIYKKYLQKLRGKQEKAEGLAKDFSADYQKTLKILLTGMTIQPEKDTGEGLYAASRN